MSDSEWITSTEAQRRYGVDAYRFSRLAKIGKVDSRPNESHKGNYLYSTGSIERWLEDRGVRESGSYQSDPGWITITEAAKMYRLATKSISSAAERHNWERKIVDGTTQRYQYDLDDFYDWFFTTKRWNLSDAGQEEARRPDARGGGYPGKDDVYFATPRRKVKCMKCDEVYGTRSHGSLGICDRCKSGADYRSDNEGDMIYQEPADWSEGKGG